jgi:antitoxin component HigA of HigAB toxin-antitoxin module
MHKLLFAPLLLAGLLAIPVALAEGGDPRVAVEMPAMMQDHMRANMRDHLNAINEIQGLLASGSYDAAADLAEKRIGMSSLEAHGASHMAGFMPQGMQATGTAMHQAASRFAVTAQEAGVTRDLPRALGALSKVTQQCVACHAGYRLQ